MKFSGLIAQAQETLFNMGFQDPWFQAGKDFSSFAPESVKTIETHIVFSNP
jgi:hypothetical protein